MRTSSRLGTKTLLLFANVVLTVCRNDSIESTTDIVISNDHSSSLGWEVNQEIEVRIHSFHSPMTSFHNYVKLMSSHLSLTKMRPLVDAMCIFVSRSRCICSYSKGDSRYGLYNIMLTRSDGFRSSSVLSVTFVSCVTCVSLRMGNVYGALRDSKILRWRPSPIGRLIVQSHFSDRQTVNHHTSTLVIQQCCRRSSYWPICSVTLSRHIDRESQLQCMVHECEIFHSS